MISKTHRLTERDIGKVLRKKKPFFSYHLVANTAPQHPKESLDHPRFAIILSGKVTKGSVVRNFFRRRFYESARPYLEKNNALDIVVVAKKGTILHPRDSAGVEAFDRDLAQLWDKIFSSK